MWLRTDLNYNPAPRTSIAMRTAFLIALLCSFGLLAACGGDDRADPEELIFAFQRQKDPEAIREQADELARRLEQKLGLRVRTQVPLEYQATVQALVSGQADVAWLSAIPFLLAQRDGGARLLLAERRRDASGELRTSYDSVFVVAQESPLRTLDDLVQQANELRICFTSQTSTSGYVMPYSRLVDEGLLKPGQDVRGAFSSATFGGSYTAALEQVLEGRADIACVSHYTVEGERADLYLTAEQRARLRILARTPSVPTHLVCVRAGLSPELEQRIRRALLEISSEDPELLARVYGASVFAEVDAEEHVRAARIAVERLGVSLEAL